MTEPRRPSDDHDSNEPFRLDLRQFVPYRLTVLAALTARAMSGVYRRQHGLTQPEWKVMSTLAHRGPLASGDVGHHITLDRVAVSRALTRLIERGFVSREVHQRDERMFLVDLTAEGSRIYDEMARDAVRIEEAILSDLEPSEVTELLRLFDKMEGYFRKHTDVRRPSLILAADEIAEKTLRPSKPKRRTSAPVKARRAAAKKPAQAR